MQGNSCIGTQREKMVEPIGVKSTHHDLSDGIVSLHEISCHRREHKYLASIAPSIIGSHQSLFKIERFVHPEPHTWLQILDQFLTSPYKSNTVSFEVPLSYSRFMRRL